MDTKELIKALREKTSRDNRELLDAAANELEYRFNENTDLLNSIIVKNHTLLMAKEDIEKTCRTCQYRQDGGGCQHPDGIDLRSTVCKRWKWRGDTVGL